MRLTKKLILESYDETTLQKLAKRLDLAVRSNASVKSLRAAIAKCPGATLDVLVAAGKASELRAICTAVGTPATGRVADLRHQLRPSTYPPAGSGSSKKKSKDPTAVASAQHLRTRGTTGAATGIRSVSWVDADDLNLWADQIDSQSRLPDLIRRLVLATSDAVTAMNMPAGSSVQLGGWDGKAQSSAATAYVPLGTSRWEFGAAGSVTAKANSDYKKRTEDPLGANRKTATFIFVTPYRWSGKDKWVADRNKEKKWGEVRAYDADDLETWLGTAPAVMAWLARHLGMKPRGVWGLEYQWESWTASTVPPCDATLTVAGRDRARLELERLLPTRTPTSTVVRASTHEEAAAFICACAVSLEGEDAARVSARMVFVDDSDSWRQLASSKKPLILVPLLDPREMAAAPLAVRSGHHVFLPLDETSPSSAESVDVGPPDTSAIATALRSTGETEQRARQLSIRFGSSLQALRRELSVTPEVVAPSWAAAPTAHELAPLLLLGCFDVSSEADKDALAELAATPYANASAILAKWSRTADAPVRLADSVWCWVSRRDAWRHLSAFLDPDLLDRFEKLAAQILATPDPRYSLPAEERWAAALSGDVPAHSDTLRKCLAESLALLACSRHKSTADPTNPSARAERTVHGIFHEAEWQLWAGLYRTLPTLAEAAPSVFLNMLEADLDADASVIRGLFSAETAMGDTPHCGMLWALETLAWSDEHVSRVLAVLARLAEIDPGGVVANRPLASLTTILLPVVPQSAGDDQRRRKLLDMLARDHAAVIAKLLPALLPGGASHTSQTAQPKWRDWPTSFSTVTYARLRVAHSHMFELALLIANEEPSLWGELIGQWSRYTPEQVQSIRAKLAKLADRELDDAVKEGIRAALRKQLNWHRSFPDHDAALTEEQLAPWQEMYDTFEPASLSYRFRWLFGSAHDDPQPASGGWEAEAEQTRRQRAAAVKAIAAGGSRAVLDFASETENPQTVGEAAADANLGNEMALELMELSCDANDGFFHWLVRRASYVNDQDWRSETFAHLARLWSLERLAALLSGYPFDEPTWALAESHSAELRSAYWKKVDARIFQDQRERAPTVIKQLLEASRPWAAVDVASRVSRDELNVEPQVVVEALLAALSSRIADEPRVPFATFPYEVHRLLAFLRKEGSTDLETLAKIEWGALPLLTTHSRYGLESLPKALAENASLFVEVVEAVYRADGEPEGEPTREQVAVAWNGSQLLQSWKGVPGLTDDSFDAERFRAWFNQVRKALREGGRERNGEPVLGAVLARVPWDETQAQPQPREIVCELLDGAKSKPLERGFRLHVINSRGGTRRGLYEGGKQERTLAERYLAAQKLVADEWPRMGAVLGDLGSSYASQAEREDADVERRPLED